MTNYEQSAKDILQWCGGADNVAGVSHCATRLRIAVNSGAKVQLTIQWSVELFSR